MLFSGVTPFPQACFLSRVSLLYRTVGYLSSLEVSLFQLFAYSTSLLLPLPP